MKEKKYLAATILCISALIMLYCGISSADKMHDAVTKAIIKVDTMGQGVRPLDPAQVAELKNELGRFFAWQSSGNLASKPKDISIAEIVMPGLRVKVSSDSEGRDYGEFISCDEQALVTMQDGTGYLFYQSQWWQIPPESQTNKTPD